MEKYMLDHLFTCDGGADCVGDASYIHYGCIIHADFGPHKAGDNVYSIFVDFETGKVETYNEGGTEVLHTGNLKVGW